MTHGAARARATAAQQRISEFCARPANDQARGWQGGRDRAVPAWHGLVCVHMVDVRDGYLAAVLVRHGRVHARLRLRLGQGLRQLPRAACP